jgi:hypothetical protein
MSQPKTPATPTPSPQQLQKISTQLRELNAAYKAAVAGGPARGSVSGSKSGK